MIQLTLPLPNSVNTHWRHAKGFTYLSEKGKVFRQMVIGHVKILNLPTLQARLQVTIWLYPRDKRKMDIDNRIKPLLDALQMAGVYADDEQIDKLIVERRAIHKGGKCIVHITEM